MKLNIKKTFKQKNHILFSNMNSFCIRNIVGTHTHPIFDPFIRLLKTNGTNTFSYIHKCFIFLHCSLNCSLWYSSEERLPLPISVLAGWVGPMMGIRSNSGIVEWQPGVVKWAAMRQNGYRQHHHQTFIQSHTHINPDANGECNFTGILITAYDGYDVDVAPLNCVIWISIKNLMSSPQGRECVNSSD